jgi:quinoprotein glucose dehydrogenase
MDTHAAAFPADAASAPTPVPPGDAPAAGRWITVVFGGLLGLLGLVFTVGGGWLAILGGSLYYLAAGLLLIASGILVACGRRSGAWIYAAALLLTLVWAVWEVGFDPWQLLPRLDGPLVLAALFLLPPIRRRLA